jgi:hypothetical protein
MAVDPIDFLTSCIVGRGGPTLTLTNGVALAFYNNKGIDLYLGTGLVSQGSPNQRNYIAYYNLIQEQPTNLDTNVTVAESFPIYSDPTIPNDGVYPTLDLRLTTICAPTGETNLWNTGTSQSISSLRMRDCEIYGSGATWQMSESTGPTVELINNVFYRVPFSIYSDATCTVFNNLFYGTTNYITNINVNGTLSTNTNTLVKIQYLGGPSLSPNTNENNVYNGVTVSLDGAVVGYNAYLNGAVNIAGGTSTDNTNTIFWNSGPLGSFYQWTGGPELTNGSTTAANLGLYHYTVLTSDAIEGSNTVSRGYHYVAVGAGDLPLDSNDDGYPDYLQDSNGSGTNDTANPWNEGTLPWIGTQPVNQYAVAGSPATFSVTAYGSAPLSYQWYSNDVSLGGATSSSYTIPSVSNADAASYTVTVSSNSTGYVTSSIATLTVVVAPSVTNTFPPTDVEYWFQTNCDQLYTFATYYGSPTPAYYSQYLSPYLEYLASYQWQFNGANIPFASGTGGPVTFVTTNDGGTNTVVLTNPAGSTDVTWANIVQANPGMVETWGQDWHGESDRPASLTNAAAIAAGEYQSIATTDAGSVVQWGVYYTKSGTNLYYVTNYSAASAPPTNGVVAVAAGMEQGLALMNNSTVYSWGLIHDEYGINWSNQPNLTNVTAIACGWAYDLALSNGTVIAWGDNTEGETGVPSYLTNVVAIAAGGTHALALQSNGTVIPWGTQPAGSTTVPPLTNPVAIAAGYSHNLVLQSNGMVVAWGDNTYGQTAIPAAASQGNVMAIAAGDNFSMALLNTGTIVEWGDNTYGETNTPMSNPTNSVNVKLIAAGGYHAMAGIWSSWVQYPVNVARDLLLIYNSNSVDSSTVFTYYTNNRPMVSTANVLPLNCTNGEIIGLTNFYGTIFTPIQNWLTANPTMRPAYVILLNDIPSRIESGGNDFSSVQWNINSQCAVGWHPFVSAINMNGTGGTNDCIQYIQKLASIGSKSVGNKILLSARLGGYTNINYYFDDTESGYDGEQIGGAAEQAVLQDGVSPISIDYTNYFPDCGTLACHITAGTNVAGYLCWGEHSSLGTNYATNYSVIFTGQSGWYLMETIESFNGQRVPDFPQGNFLSWYASNSFGGVNYSNTPVGAISNVEEPGSAPSPADGGTYFGLWAKGKNAGICAWNAVNSSFFQEIGDPLVTQ